VQVSKQLENVLFQPSPCPQTFWCLLLIGAFTTMLWYSWLDSRISVEDQATW